ncbi:MAG: hypothetical protein ABSH14_11935 [Verrucomicrobiia bacterium]|jgi:hypothetical protein
MIEIILLIVGIVYALRRPKLRKLTTQDFPGVDTARFSEWQQAELKGIDIFLWATWGAFVIKIALTVVLSQIPLSESAAITVMVVILVAWLGGLTIAGIQGSKAKKLRTAAGIKWPK